VINAVCLSKCIAVDWSKTELMRLGSVLDQTLVLARRLVGDFGLRPKLSYTSVFALLVFRSQTKVYNSEKITFLILIAHIFKNAYIDLKLISVWISVN